MDAKIAAPSLAKSGFSICIPSLGGVILSEAVLQAERKSLP
jgi:hypothetical protein